MTLLLDFETRSRADLKKCGGRIYAEHATTEPLCAVLHDTETGARGAWLPGDPPPPPDAQLAAHNADGFDRFIGQRLDWPAAHRPWIDTSIAARRAGLPGALDALGTRWLGIPKDAAGSRFTKSLSRPRRGKLHHGELPELTSEVMTRVLRYCASDVEIMAHGWPHLRPYLEDGVFGGWEADVLAVDRVINDRGIAFDQDLARRLLAIDERAGARALEAAAAALGWTVDVTTDVVWSPIMLAPCLGTDDVQAATIERLVADPATPPWARALAHARQAVASIAAGKLRAGLARCSDDGRLRDSHRYYGAHPGRWSGRGLQPHNFPRPAKHLEGLDDAAVMALCDRADLDGDEIMIAVRGCMTASPGNTLAVCDFSGVESRMIAWCAGDTDALDVVLSGRDPYKTEAAPFFGVAYDDVTKTQRNAGKMAVLACGYQGGENALLKIARQNRFSFEAAGVNPADVVTSFRRNHPALVRFWRALNDAFVAAAEGRTGRVDRFEFVPSSSGRDVAIFMPSGRPIVYNDVRMSAGKYGPSADYHGTKSREHLYGGKIAQNIIEGICRDLLADALVRAEIAGLCPVLHVHDEIVCDVPAGAAAEGAAELKRIMLDLPEWAAGFPVGAAGHHGTRYRK